MTKAILSERAKKAMKNEISRFPYLETGGLLLGYYHENDDVLHVIEATDGGYHKVIHEEIAFQYDVDYVTHVCDILIHLYEPELQIIGFWHKHNQQCKVHFSLADEKMHDQLLEMSNHPCLSILYEKTAEDEYDVLIFLLDNNQCIQIEE